MSHLSWPTRHFFQNSTLVQRVNVMTNNLLTRTRVVILLWGGAVVVFPTSYFLVKTRLGPPTTALSFFLVLPGRGWHPDCCNTPANSQMFSFPAPGTPAGRPHTPPATRQTRFSVLRTNNDSAASHHNPVCQHSQATHMAAMILSGCFHTFSPTSHNSCLAPSNYKCPKTWNLWVEWCGQEHDSSLLLGHGHLLFCPNVRYEILFDNIQIILDRVVTHHRYLIAPVQ